MSRVWLDAERIDETKCEGPASYHFASCIGQTTTCVETIVRVRPHQGGVR